MTDSDIPDDEDIIVPKVFVINHRSNYVADLKGTLAGRFDITVFEEAKAGLAAIYKYHPDVVIIEEKVPPIGGMRILEIKRSDNSLGHIPFIVTGNSDDKFQNVGYVGNPDGGTDVYTDISQMASNS